MQMCYALHVASWNQMMNLRHQHQHILPSVFEIIDQTHTMIIHSIRFELFPIRISSEIRISIRHQSIMIIIVEWGNTI